MPEIVCPNCAERLDVPPDLIHEPIRCGGCQFVIKFGGDSPRSSDEDRSRRRDYEELRHEDDHPRRRSFDEDRFDDDRPRRRGFEEEDRYDDRPRRRSFDEDRYDDRPVRRKKGSLMWLWILLAVGGILVVGVCICAGVAINRVANPSWAKFSSPDGRYSVDLPGKPQTHTQMVPDGIGNTQAVNFYAGERAFGKEAFLVGCVDLPPGNTADRDFVMKECLDEMKKPQVGATYREKSRKNVSVLGQSAVEATADFSDKDIPQAVMVTRVVILNNRLYMLMAIGTGTGPKKEDMDRFFNSFQSSDAKKK